MEPRRMGRLRLVTLAAILAAQASLPAVVAADWSLLDRLQHTITRAEFDRLLTAVYCPSLAITNYLTYTTNSVAVHSTPDKTNTIFTLRFATTPFPIQHRPFPIKRIVLDPGHIGG